jgi:DNA topoisomerase-1
MNLVIVESPTKARKLAEYLGNDYKVLASVGHVRDLPQSELGIDIEHNFQPTYVVSEDKTKVLSELKKYAKEAKQIYLATDPDREGEAIAWHLQFLLSEKVKVKPEFLRSTFHEITKAAVTDAIEHPSELRMDLVNAQQARRVVDRLVGYQLSPVLWQKVRRGLSAGRVQSVALRLIVEREREIEGFKPEEYWELDVLLALRAEAKFAKLATEPGEKPSWLETAPDEMLVARVVKLQDKTFEPHQSDQVQPLVEWLPAAKFTIISVERKKRNTSSLPPFTTSTLQQAAANRLGMTSKQTMRLAQDLYEEGLITYHRTDSVSLSSQSIEQAREYIQSSFGQQYMPEKPRFFANKSKNAQEAHEAIRVTHVAKESIIGVSGQISDRHQKLYDLIRRRYLASQMADAVNDQTTILIKAEAKTGSDQAQLKANGSTILFDGWRRLFPVKEEVILPAVEANQDLHFQDLNAAQKFTQPPARYNDASLVKELEKRGIGRPSTYASIISVIETRGYVSRDNKRFIATPVGMTVSDFLLKHFQTIMDYDFTAEMEEDLDRVARGEKEWQKVVKTFYAPLEKTIGEVKKNAQREQIPVEKTGEKCPKCGDTDQGEIVIRTGRFGKFKSCSRFPECDFTENMVEKLDGMKCPLCGEGDVIARKSRWGKLFYGCSTYPKCNWASWQKPELGLKVTPEEWAVMQAERKAKAEIRMAKRGKTTPTAKTTKTKKPVSKKAKTKKK